MAKKSGSSRELPLLSFLSIFNDWSELEIDPVVARAEVVRCCVIYVRLSAVVVVVAEQVSLVDRTAIIHISPGPDLHLTQRYVAEAVGTGIGYRRIGYIHTGRRVPKEDLEFLRSGYRIERRLRVYQSVTVIIVSSSRSQISRRVP